MRAAAPARLEQVRLPCRSTNHVQPGGANLEAEHGRVEVLRVELLFEAVHHSGRELRVRGAVRREDGAVQAAQVRHKRMRLPLRLQRRRR